MRSKLPVTGEFVFFVLSINQLDSVLFDIWKLSKFQTNTIL